MAQWVKVDEKAGLADVEAIRELYKATPADFHVPRENVANKLTCSMRREILPASLNPSYDSFVVKPNPAK